MSNAVLTAVFEHSRTRNGARLVMLTLADRANDAGRCWPGIEDLMRRTGLSKTGVYTATKQAKKLGELHVDEYGGPNHTHLYTIRIPNGSDPKPFRIETDTVQIPDATGSDSEHKPSLTLKNPQSLDRKGRRAKPKSEEDPDFAIFWATYPRKIAKAKALKAWQATSRDRPPLEELLGALAKHKASRQWSDPQFIAHPATWLNQHRWADELKADEPIQPQARRVQL